MTRDEKDGSFVVTDLSERWYKFEPIIKRRGDTQAALDLEKKRREELKRKVDDKLNKLDFVKASNARAMKEERALKEAPTDDREGWDHNDDWSDDEGNIAPDADDTERDGANETSLTFIDDLDLREDEGDLDEDEVDLDALDADALISLEELDSSKKRPREDDFDSRESKRVRPAGSLEDDIRDFFQFHGKVDLNRFTRTFLSGIPESELKDRKTALLQIVKDQCKSVTENGQRFFVLK